MITTITTKQQQLKNTYFKVGTGTVNILVIGSCRAVPYLNYFDKWNQSFGERFSIHFIDPFNWNWDENDNRVDYNEKLKELETDERLLNMIRETDIFIHEYYANSGMFNVNKSAENNIYKYGMKAIIDLTLPNFNDVFILTKEILDFNVDLKKQAVQDFNVLGKLSNQTLAEIDKIRQQNLDKFYDICSKTDFPDFAHFFKANYKKYRLFWTFNHVSKWYNLYLFFELCKRLNMETTYNFEQLISQHDLFENNYTHLCEYDEGFDFKEDIKPLF